MYLLKFPQWWHFLTSKRLHNNTHRATQTSKRFLSPHTLYLTPTRTSYIYTVSTDLRSHFIKSPLLYTAASSHTGSFFFRQWPEMDESENNEWSSAETGHPHVHGAAASHVRAIWRPAACPQTPGCDGRAGCIKLSAVSETRIRKLPPVQIAALTPWRSASSLVTRAAPPIPKRDRKMVINGSHFNSSTLSRPPWVTTTLGCILIFTIVVDILGNLLVIFSVYRNKRLRNAGERVRCPGRPVPSLPARLCFNPLIM